MAFPTPANRSPLLRLAIVVIASTLPDVGQAWPLVGAYYYPWYGAFAGGHAGNDMLRAKLAPQQPPALGYYSSRASATIGGQIEQSHRGRRFVVAGRDRTLRISNTIADGCADIRQLVDELNREITLIASPFHGYASPLKKAGATPIETRPISRL